MTTHQMTVLVAGPPRAVVLDLGRAEARRAAGYAALVRDLCMGRLDPLAFAQRVRGWAPLAGHRLVSDPDTVLALVDRMRAEDVDPFTDHEEEP
jgi:hypothetical protein